MKALILAILLMALPAAAQSIGSGAQAFKLENGLRVVLLEDHQFPLIHLQFRAAWAPMDAVGAALGSEARGQASSRKPKDLTPLEPLALGMLDQCPAGRRSRTAFNRATEERGLSLRLSGGLDGPVWNLSGGSPEVESAFSLLADATTHAILDGGDLDSVRLLLIHDLHEAGSQETARTNFLRLLRRPDTAMEAITESSLGQIYLEDIQRAVTNTLRPGRAVLAISGDLNLSQARQLAQLSFGAWNEGTDAKSSLAPAAPGGSGSSGSSTSPIRPAGSLAHRPLAVPSDRAETTFAIPFRATDEGQRAATELVGIWLPRMLGVERCLIYRGAAGWRSFVLTADASEASIREALLGIKKAGLKADDLEQARALWLADRRAISLHPQEQLNFTAKEALLGAEPSEQQIQAVDLSRFNKALQSWLNLDSARVLIFNGNQAAEPRTH